MAGFVERMAYAPTHDNDVFAPANAFRDFFGFLPHGSVVLPVGFVAGSVSFDDTGTFGVVEVVVEHERIAEAGVVAVTVNAGFVG